MATDLTRYGRAVDASKDRDPLAYRGRRPAPIPAPAPEPEWMSIDAALREFEVGMTDAAADYPDVAEIDVAHDVAHSMALWVSPADRPAFIRRAVS